MAASRSHLTALPPGFIIVRILQLLFTITVFALSILMIVEWGRATQYVVMITAVVALIPIIWILIASYKQPGLYNYWALLAMELLCLALWTNGWVFAFASTFRPNDTGCYLIPVDSQPYYQFQCIEIPNRSLFRVASRCSYVILGLTGSLAILWLVSLIVVSVFIARHRNAGGHSKRGSEAPMREK